MPTVILDKSDIEDIIKKQYGLTELTWKIIKKDVKIEFKQELEQKQNTQIDKKEIKKEYKKRPDGLMNTERPALQTF